MVMIVRQQKRLLVTEVADRRSVADFVGIGEPARVLRERFRDASEALQYLENIDGYGVEIADSALEPVEV